MGKLLIIRISFALQTARWRQTMVAAVGVAFSITMFITLLSFMAGLNDLLDGLLLNRTPHVRLFNEIKAPERLPINLAPDYQSHYNFVRSVKPKMERLQINNIAAIIAAVEKDERVLGYAPKIGAQVFYNTGATDLTGLINGIDVTAENKLFFFSDYIVAGNFNDLNTIPNSIILGKEIAAKTLTNIGDVIQVTTSKGDIRQLKVVGFFQSGIQEIDKVQSYASLKTTQNLMGEAGSYITDLQIKLKDLSMAPAMAKEYAGLFETDAVDIQTANSQFETGSKVRTLISYAVGVTLLIVAGFGIYNILNMIIYEKMDSIAILKATGFSGKDVNKIFLFIALSIGISGGIAGLFFGWGLSAIIDQIPFNTASLPTVTTYPINYNPVFYVTGLVFALITTYMAGYFPSRKASKMDPVTIIRGK
ncbi:MAG: ABC transporter permease [Bacteroidota bacterium]|jgi:lipoprotein-releasing system permease protein|nr:ABC transporter permease [Sediminibacterium sp.]